MHNIRSALDHAAVALVSPQKQRYASFPIFTSDLDEVDEITSGYLHTRDRRNWRRSVQDMPDRAVAFLQIVQPYRLATNGEDANDHALALLRAFQDADKHRELSVIAQGLIDPTFSFIEPSGVVTTNPPPAHAAPPDSIMRNGAIVNVDFSNPPQQLEMEIEGTPRIVIGSSMDGPMRECPAVFDNMLRLAREIVHDLAVGDWT